MNDSLQQPVDVAVIARRQDDGENRGAPHPVESCPLDESGRWNEELVVEVFLVAHVVGSIDEALALEQRRDLHAPHTHGPCNRRLGRTRAFDLEHEPLLVREPLRQATCGHYDHSQKEKRHSAPADYGRHRLYLVGST